jgi:TPR repeat protein
MEAEVRFPRLFAAAMALAAAAATADERPDTDIMNDAREALNREDYDSARRLMLPLAGRGHAEAMFRMGIIYERGLGVEPDMEIAEQFYSGYCPLPAEAAQ